MPPSYLYAVVLIIVVDPLAAAWSYANGYPVVYLDNPYFVLQPLALVTAVYGSRSLLAAYDDVMAEMNVEDRATEVEEIRRRMELVSSTNGYPATFSIGRSYCSPS